MTNIASETAMDIIEATQKNAEQLLSLSKTAAQVGHAMRETKRHNLKDDEKRVMEYFWNRHLQRPRRTLPLQVIAFLETDREPPGGETYSQEQLGRTIGTLMARGYIHLVEHRAEVQLDVDGMAWLKDQHPSVVMWWQRFLQRLPPILQMGYAAVGFIASVYGVIEFGKWITEPKTVPPNATPQQMRPSPHSGTTGER